MRAASLSVRAATHRPTLDQLRSTWFGAARPVAATRTSCAADWKSSLSRCRTRRRERRRAQVARRFHAHASRSACPSTKRAAGRLSRSQRLVPEEYRRPAPYSSLRASARCASVLRESHRTAQAEAVTAAAPPAGRASATPPAQVGLPHRCGRHTKSPRCVRRRTFSNWCPQPVAALRCQRIRPQVQALAVAVDLMDQRLVRCPRRRESLRRRRFSMLGRSAVRGWRPSRRPCARSKRPWSRGRWTVSPDVGNAAASHLLTTGRWPTVCGREPRARFAGACRPSTPRPARRPRTVYRAAASGQCWPP